MRMSWFVALVPLADTVLFVPASGEDIFKDVSMLKCKAARIDKMSSKVKTKTLAALNRHKGSDWWGEPLAGGREEYFYKRKWDSSEACHFKCKTKCLIPAATYGFDAATCKIHNKPNSAWCIAGYTPDVLNVCHGPDKEEACDDECPTGWADCTSRQGVTGNCKFVNCFLFKKYRDDYLLRPKLDDVADPKAKLKFDNSTYWHLDETTDFDSWKRYRGGEKSLPPWNPDALKNLKDAGLNGRNKGE